MDDALRTDPSKRFSMVLTNLPFGGKSSITFVNGDRETERETLTVVRDDFWAKTSSSTLCSTSRRVRPRMDVVTSQPFSRRAPASPLVLGAGRAPRR